MSTFGSDAGDDRRGHRDDDVVVPVATFANAAEAEAVARLLVAAGIPAVPRVEHAEWHEYGRSRATDIQLSVVVPVHLLDAAYAALDAHQPSEGSATRAEIEAALAGDDLDADTGPTPMQARMDWIDAQARRCMRVLLWLLGIAVALALGRRFL